MRVDLQGKEQVSDSLPVVGESNWIRRSVFQGLMLVSRKVDIALGIKGAEGGGGTGCAKRASLMRSQYHC